MATDQRQWSIDNINENNFGLSLNNKQNDDSPMNFNYNKNGNFTKIFF